MGTYFNTTREKGRKLYAYREKARTQEEIIKDIFKMEFDGLTAVDVMRRFPKKHTPITSIRRALSNLTESGFLIKTDHKKEGLFGRDNVMYKLNTGELILDL